MGTKCCNKEMQKEEPPIRFGGETKYVCLKCGMFILIGQLYEEELMKEREDNNYVDENIEAKADLIRKYGGWQ